MPIKGNQRLLGPKGRPIVSMALKIRRDPLNVRKRPVLAVLKTGFVTTIGGAVLQGS
jgi:hypothetical protein